MWHSNTHTKSHLFEIWGSIIVFVLHCNDFVFIGHSVRSRDKERSLITVHDSEMAKFFPFTPNGVPFFMQIINCTKFSWIEFHDFRSIVFNLRKKYRTKTFIETTSCARVFADISGIVVGAQCLNFDCHRCRCYGPLYPFIFALFSKTDVWKPLGLWRLMARFQSRRPHSGVGGRAEWRLIQQHNHPWMMVFVLWVPHAVSCTMYAIRPFDRAYIVWSLCRPHTPHIKWLFNKINKSSETQ